MKDKNFWLSVSDLESDHVFIVLNSEYKNRSHDEVDKIRSLELKSEKK